MPRDKKNLSGRHFGHKGHKFDSSGLGSTKLLVGMPRLYAKLATYEARKHEPAIGRIRYRYYPTTGLVAFAVLVGYF